MNYYLITHTHKYGTDHHLVKSEKKIENIPDEEVFKLLGIDFEAELNEDINYFNINFDEIPELK